MSLVIEPQKSEILIYQNPDGRIKIDVMLHEETVWLTQKLDGAALSGETAEYHHAPEKHLLGRRIEPRGNL